MFARDNNLRALCGFHCVLCGKINRKIHKGFRKVRKFSFAVIHVIRHCSIQPSNNSTVKHPKNFSLFVLHYSLLTIHFSGFSPDWHSPHASFERSLWRTSRRPPLRTTGRTPTSKAGSCRQSSRATSLPRNTPQGRQRQNKQRRSSDRSC